MATLRIVSDFLTQIAPAITFGTVLVALWQIRIAKNALVTSSKREAVTLAADKCKEAAETLIPLHTELVTKKLIFLWELKEDKTCGLRLSNLNEAMTWIENTRPNIEAFASLVNFSNKIESFAMYFANGAADEQIAYPAMGKTFCDWINNIAPVIVWMRKANNCTSYYSSSLSLYKTWSQRMTKEKNCAEILRLKADNKKLSDESRKPIGT